MAAAALTLAVAGSVGATGANKTFGATVTPTPVAGGAPVQFTLQLTNTADNQQLGSANVVLPPGFTAISSGDGFEVDQATRTVKLRNLAIPATSPDTSRAYTITATPPCTVGTASWSVYAKQSNEFNGPSGNNFSPYPLTGSASYPGLQTTLSGCPVKLVFGKQPAAAGIGHVITNQPYAPASASKVEVWAVDPNDADCFPASPAAGSTLSADCTVRTGTTGQVAVTRSVVTGSGVLQGSPTTFALTGGKATVTGLSISSAGTYKLDAAPVAASFNTTVLAPSPASATFRVDELKLAFTVQPRDAERNAVITGTPFLPTGPNVRVDVVVGTSTPVAGVTGTVALTRQGGTGTLSGGSASLGSCDAGTASCATFPALALDANGTYTLLAQSSGLTQATSDPNGFVIVDAGEYCPHEGTSSDDCEVLDVPQPAGNGNLLVDARAENLDNSNSGSGATTLLLRSLGANEVAWTSYCAGFVSTLGSGSYLDVRPLATKTLVTVYIPKGVRQYKANNGLAKIDICLGTNLQFVTKGGGRSVGVDANGVVTTTQAGIERWYGVLPDCSATTTNPAPYTSVTVPSPCVVYRMSVNGGAEVRFEVPYTTLLGVDGLQAYDPSWSIGD